MRTQYEQAAEMWNNLRREFLYAQELADAANMAAGVDKKRNTMLWRAYWAAHQRFFRSMCMAAKVGRQHLPPCQAVQHGPLCSICTTNSSKSFCTQGHAVMAAGQPFFRSDCTAAKVSPLHVEASWNAVLTFCEGPVGGLQE